MKLSPRQQDALDELKRTIKSSGFAPTSRELGKSLGVTQTAARGYLLALERKGRIRRIAGQARAITIL